MNIMEKKPRKIYTRKNLKNKKRVCQSEEEKKLKKKAYVLRSKGRIKLYNTNNRDSINAYNRVYAKDRIHNNPTVKLARHTSKEKHRIKVRDLKREVRCIVKFIKDYVKIKVVKPKRVLLTDEEKRLRVKVYRAGRAKNKRVSTPESRKRKRELAKIKKLSLTPEQKIVRREKRRIAKHKKFAAEPFYRVKDNLRKACGDAFRCKRWKKGGATEQLLGTTYDIFKLHIYKLFTKGMSWENYGLWHIDHKVPIASAKNEEELRVLFHYKNLQPLWAKDNIEKSDKILPIQIALTI